MLPPADQDLTATSIRATQTLTGTKYFIADSVGITPALSTLPPGRWSRSSRCALARTRYLSAHPRSGGCNGRNVPQKVIPDPRRSDVGLSGAAIRRGISL